MRIRTLLQASLALTTVMVLGLAVANWSISARLAEISIAEDRVQSCSRDISDLLVLTQEYAMYSEERSVQQWKTLHSAIVKKLEASVHDVIPPPADTLKAAQTLPEIFQQLITTVSNSSDLQNRQRNLLLNQLHSGSQVLADSVLSWGIALDEHRNKIEQLSRIQSIVIPAMMLLILMLLSFLLHRRLLRPLAQLGKAVTAVAKGDLTVRSATASNDEFGELSRTFDAMAIDLVAEMQREIMVRKLAEEKLFESENRFRLINDSIQDQIYSYDLSNRFTFANRPLCENLGRKEDEVIGRTYWEFGFPEELCRKWDEMHRQAYVTGSKVEIVSTPMPDGTVLHFEVNLSVIYDSGGEVIGLAGVNRNITDRKRAEEEKLALEQQFQQTQKLESLGVLAGGIAHDFNNILAIIVGYCGLTKMDYEDAEKHIPEIEKAAERAAALCRQMLAYAGKASLTQTQVNTPMLIDEMVSMLKTTIKQNVVIKPELGTDIPFIMGDASQIRQVVMNLIINAAEAIGDADGEIDVKLAKAEIKTGQSEKDHLGMIIPAGRYICFEVTDNGCGMDEDTRRKIFEPFYTTKFTGRGLGMSAVLGIIKAHNGALQLESRLGHGTVFKVYLPVQLSKSETEEAHQKAVSAVWQGSGTILLAEDEVQVKSIAIALLENLGFSVLDAANGKEALELYQKNAADITLVVTDMGMPVMNGYELFYKLKQLDPQLPIIISSGFGEGDIVSKIPLEAMAGIINKPYSFDRLREVLRVVVERTE
ncbi:MAG: PAS domain S-box protein [Chitinophagaceae bacterium]|nr:PAS domain S-box protein [Chitinophagaceae bacterium]